MVFFSYFSPHSNLLVASEYCEILAVSSPTQYNTISGCEAQGSKGAFCGISGSLLKEHIQTVQGIGKVSKTKTKILKIKPVILNESICILKYKKKDWMKLKIIKYGNKAKILNDDDNKGTTGNIFLMDYSQICQSLGWLSVIG